MLCMFDCSMIRVCVASHVICLQVRARFFSYQVQHTRTNADEHAEFPSVATHVVCHMQLLPRCQAPTCQVRFYFTTLELLVFLCYNKKACFAGRCSRLPIQGQPFGLSGIFHIPQPNRESYIFPKLAEQANVSLLHYMQESRPPPIHPAVN